MVRPIGDNRPSFDGQFADSELPIAGRLVILYSCRGSQLQIVANLEWAVNWLQLGPSGRELDDKMTRIQDVMQLAAR